MEGAPKKEPTEWRHVMKVDERPKGWFSKRVGLAALAALGMAGKSMLPEKSSLFSDRTVPPAAQREAPQTEQLVAQIEKEEEKSPAGGGQP